MDNFFRGCPAMMNDGFRPLTDHKTATRRAEYIKYINDLWNNNQERLFLQQNGYEFLQKEHNYHKNKNSCFVNDCVHIYPTRSTPRHLWQEMQVYNSIYDKNTNEKLAPMRVCYPYKDYRLNPRN